MSKKTKTSAVATDPKQMNVNVQDVSEATLKVADTIECIVLNIRPLLPLFFKHQMLETAPKSDDVYDDETLENIMYDIEIEDGKELNYHELGWKVLVETYGETAQEAKEAFAKKIYDVFFTDDKRYFKEIQAVNKIDEIDIYNQFTNQPTEAAHFMFQKYLTTSGEYMVCEDVMKLVLEGNETRVDFAFGWYDDMSKEGASLGKLSRNRLDEFRIYKEFVLNRGVKPADLNRYLDDFITVGIDDSGVSHTNSSVDTHTFDKPFGFVLDNRKWQAYL